MRLEVPEAASDIVRRLEERGFETWAVGGAVRDALLSGSRADWDLATAARPEVVRKLFRPSYPIGIQFGTIGVRGSDGYVYEVTTFRRDLETDGRHAVVEYADTLDEDLGRRDFTINAIAYHPLRHELHDPYDGRGDLDRRILRCVGDPTLRFSEDYLRVLRGLRFAGRYELEIEDATWDALKAAVSNLPQLSGERVREELLKVLAGPAPSRSLELYRNSGALHRVFGEVAGLEDTEWRITLEAIDRIPAEETGLRLALLFRPAGFEIEAMMARTRFSNAEVRGVVNLADALDQPLPQPGDEVSARRWLRDVTPALASYTLLLHMVLLEAMGAGAKERKRLAEQAKVIETVRERGDPVTLGDLAIDGNDLKEMGMLPGPEIGRALEACLTAVIEDPSLNEQAVLLAYVSGMRDEE